MNSVPNFEKLASGLSADERFRLLDRIKTEGSVGSDPLYENTEDSDAQELEAFYGRLSIIKKLVLFFVALFNKKDSMQFLEETIIARIAKDIEKTHTGIYSQKTMTLGGAFASELRKLQDSLEVYMGPLKIAFSTYKSEFIASLAALEMPDVIEKLLEISNLENLSEGGDSLNEFDARRKMEKGVQETLEGIGEAQRSIMYQHLRSLHLLNELVLFPYQRLLTQFKKNQGGESAKLSLLKNDLMDLGDILASFTQPVEDIALKALFLFDDEDAELKDEDLTKDLQEKMDRSIDALKAIRSFNRIVPLPNLLKVCTRNVSYRAEQLGGGEDWFAQFRLYWSDYLEQTIKTFAYQNQKKRITGDALKLLSVDKLMLLPHYRSILYSSDVSVQYENTIGFIFRFSEYLFSREIARILKMFLVNGEFYKTQNRADFTDSFGKLVNVLTELQTFEDRLSSDGELGEELSSIEGEMVKQSLRTRKVVTILRAVDLRAEELIRFFSENLLLMISVVKGILYGEGSGSYDTLSNISYIGGTDNRSLLMRLGVALQQMEEAAKITSEFWDLERSIG